MKRTTPDGTWTYTHTPPATSGGISNTSVVDPSNNKTVYTFSGPYEVQRQMYDSTGALLQTVVTCYNNNLTNCSSASVSTPIIRRTVFTQIPNSTGKQSETDVFYSTVGLVTEEDDYDFGSGTVGALLRKTVIQYAVLSNNIFDRPSSRIVYDSSNNVKSATYFAYDEGSVAASTGTPQHIAVTGSRGNLTTVQSLVSGTTYLTRHYTYFDTGTVKTATDVNQAITTYNYSDATSTCGNAFPTSVNLPLNLTTSSTYDCVGRVPKTSTDVTGRPTTFTYGDPLYRVTAVASPYQNGTFTTTSTSYLSPTKIETTLNVTSGGAVVDVATYLDSLGRTLRTQKQDGTSYDTVSYRYDANGRISQQTLPCLALAGADCAFTPTTATTYQYDGLSRQVKVTDSGGGYVQFQYPGNDVLQTIGPATTIPATEALKQKQFEYDGLGRMTSVCELTSYPGGPGNCLQSTGYPGWTTRYQYDAASRLTGVCQATAVALGIDCVLHPSSGQQTRTFVYDNLGRMNSENNPENGLVTYIYDSDPNAVCPTSNGDLVRQVNGTTVTCFAYDGLHRMTAAGNGNINGSTARYFVYDSATVAATSMSNAIGRLAEAYTVIVPNFSTKTTDEGFSYNDRGDLTDVYQSTPNSGGYYHSIAQYYENGALSSLSPGVTGGQVVLPWTFGLDSAGRPYSEANPNGTILQSTSYNPDGTIASLRHANGDNEVYAYQNGRMTQYQFNIGTTPTTFTGSLTWNANGTLQLLGINDGFNTNNSQSCIFSHDDLSRIASVNCTKSGGANIWNQVFSYDAFGNVTKTVPAGGTGIGFAPGYDASTNHYLGVSYTAGNPQNDGAHAYTWDANWGSPVSIDSTNLIYDALGRMVEQQNGTTNTQVMYGPTGKVALMSGQTEIQSFQPFPGGGVFVHRPGSLTNYWRHPNWLGSSGLATTLPGRIKFYDGSYAPFGEDYNGTGTKDLDFTGQIQDTTTTVGGLYDFPFREYAPRQGRWVSPDPAGIGAVAMGNPQTWNRYAYVGNSPLAITDPTGMSPGQGWRPGQPINSCGSISPPAPGEPWPCLGPETETRGGTKDWCILDGVISDCGFITQNSESVANLPVGCIWTVCVTSSGIVHIQPKGDGQFGGCGGSYPDYFCIRFAATSPDGPPEPVAANNGSWWSGLTHSPWVVSWILPLGPVPGVAGVGPAGSFAWNPATKTLCGSIGAGASVGDNLAGGPVTGRTLNGQQATPSQINKIFSGWSVNFGFNVPTGPVPVGPGAQVSGNGSGVVYGPTVGVAGASLSSTYAVCASF